jgi:hypothetical protein
MSITVKTRKTLWGKSGNRCAICRKELVLEKDQFDVTLNLGEECHIISSQAGGPRHEIIQNFDYNQVENLLLLCCNDHKMIDEQIGNYPKAKLIEIKDKHEFWVQNTLNNTKEARPNQISLQDNLLDFLSNKNQKVASMKYSTEILYSPQSLDLAFEEVRKLKQHIKEFFEKAKLAAPDFDIILRDNSHHLSDIMSNGYTLLSQFYQAYGNMALNSYLLFAVVKGYFDAHGHSDPFNPAQKEELIRLSCDNSGNFGWRNKENKEKFYTSEEIADLWLDKFFRKSFK